MTHSVNLLKIITKASARAKIIFGGHFMNGLKYIRTRCNYSQRALAETLGVSRQAVNMWENSKKLPSKERKEDLCTVFGIDNPDFFGELTPELYENLKTLPTYKVPFEGDSEKFSFKSYEAPDWKFCAQYRHDKGEEQLSLDDKCALKRLEFKKLLDDISDFVIQDEVKNSYNNLTAINRTMRIFSGALDLSKEARIKFPEYVMVYYHTFFAILDAMNISFGLAEKSDIINQDIDPVAQRLYDYRDFTIELSDFITKHLDTICNEVQSKRENPHANYRRRTKKISKYY